MAPPSSRRTRTHERLARPAPQVNLPGDRFERAADQLASDALRAPVATIAAAADLAPVQEEAGAGLGSGGQTLDTTTRAEMEARFRHDFSRVRVFAGADAAASARSAGAAAYTLGRDIVFGAGRYAPGTTAGRDLLAHELAHVVQQAGAPGPLGRPAAGVAQARHLSLDEAIQQFTSKIDSAAPSAKPEEVPSIHETGQFYWANQIEAQIQHDASVALTDPSWDRDEAAMLKSLINGCLAAIWDASPDIDKVFKDAQDEIKRSSNPLKARLLPLFVDRSHHTGADIDALLWKFRTTKELIPELKPYRSIPVMRKVHAAESVACGPTARAMVARFFAKGGFKDADADKRHDDRKLKGKKIGLASGITRHTFSRVEGGITYYKGDEVLYGGIGKHVTEMKKALDTGFLVYARVLSGWGVGHTVPKKLNGPTPKLITEHSIVILGYDGDIFAFWDPDSQATQVIGAGLGYIYFSAGRFGTSNGDQSFMVDSEGDHAGGDHRYQVVSVEYV